MAKLCAPGITQWKLQQTAALCMGSFAFSFFLCLLGPSLLDLQITANTNTKSMTMVFLGRSIGGILGSASFAFLLTKYNRILVLSASYFIMGIVMTSLPWLGNVTAITLVYGVGGVAFSVADVGTLTHLMQIWGSKSGPWLQSMYACYYIGCLVSTLLAKPFLSVSEGTKAKTTSECYGSLNSPQTNILGLDYADSNAPNISVRGALSMRDNYMRESQSSSYGVSLEPFTVSQDMMINSTISFEDSLHSPETHIWKAYLIAGVILFIATMLSLTVYIFDKERNKPHEDTTKKPTNKEAGESKVRGLVILLIAQTAVFLFIICCMHRGTISYFFAYVVHCRSWEKGQAVLLKTVYQSGILSGIFLSIILLVRVRPQLLLVACCVGAVASVSTLTYGGDEAALMWISTIVVGLCMGPTYGYALSWGNQYFTVDGKVAAVFTVSLAISDIMGTLVINLLFFQFGLLTYIYYALTLTIVMTAVTLSMFLSVRRLKAKRSEYVLAADGTAKPMVTDSNI